MAEVLSVELPWPPSNNTYWRHCRGRHFISNAGKAYREEVYYAIKSINWRMTFRGRLSVQVWASPPDKRRRDLDNLYKGLLDSLTHAQVWEDDEQIDRLCIERGPVEPPGKVIVSVCPLREAA